jgi:hypothetical protein
VVLLPLESFQDMPSGDAMYSLHNIWGPPARCRKISTQSGHALLSCLFCSKVAERSFRDAAHKKAVRPHPPVLPPTQTLRGLGAQLVSLSPPLVDSLQRLSTLRSYHSTHHSLLASPSMPRISLVLASPRPTSSLPITAFHRCLSHCPMHLVMSSES